MKRRGHRRRRGHRHGVRGRLYLQIYLAFVGVVVVCMVTAVILARALSDRDQHLPPFVKAVATLVVRDLPDGEGLGPALEQRARELDARASLWSASGERLAGDTAHPRPDLARDFHWYGRGPQTAFHVRLDDGRLLMLSIAETHFPGHGLPFVLMIGLLALTMAAATHPLARRIARRLERLERGVERFGEGELGARVDVEGRDEIADVARAFNRAADRIDALVSQREELVEQQKRVLASASHELRAPLTRLRMALELLLEGSAPSEARREELLSQCSGDIGELDALVGDVLLAARLENPEQARALSQNFSSLDLVELVRAEAQRVGAQVALGELADLRGEGDPRLLSRMLRNLLDNAKKHGDGAIEVQLAQTEGGALITVSDAGPGVPEAERERIFEPFYRPQGHSEGRDGGVGLGLSLVRHVAEAHGGHARCVPRDGGGSHFEVALPNFT